MKKIEEEDLGIEIYRLRTRPRIGRFKFHFDRAFFMIGVVYGATVGVVVGWTVLFLFLAALTTGYVFLSAVTFRDPDEPLEHKEHGTPAGRQQ